MAQRQPKALMVPTSAKSEAAIIVGYDGELYAWNEAGDETPLTGGTVGTSLGKLANELRNEVVSAEGTVRYLKGFTTEGDGGEGQFQWSNTVAADDGGTVLNVGDFGSSSAGWRRVYSGALDVRWFGADPTGAVDSATAINRAIAVAVSASGLRVRLVGRAPDGSVAKYRIKSTITIAAAVGTIIEGEKGQPSGFDVSTPTIFWDGAANGTMIALTNPSRVTIQNLEIDGKDSADYGVVATVTSGGTGVGNYRHITIHNCNKNPWKNLAASSLDGGRNRWFRCTLQRSATASLGKDNAAVLYEGVSNVQDVWDHCEFFNVAVGGGYVTNGRAIWFESGNPYVVFRDCYTFAAWGVDSVTSSNSPTPVLRFDHHYSEDSEFAKLGNIPARQEFLECLHVGAGTNSITWAGSSTTGFPLVIDGGNFNGKFTASSAGQPFIFANNPNFIGGLTVARAADCIRIGRPGVYTLDTVGAVNAAGFAPCSYAAIKTTGPVANPTPTGGDVCFIDLGVMAGNTNVAEPTQVNADWDVNRTHEFHIIGDGSSAFSVTFDSHYKLAGGTYAHSGIGKLDIIRFRFDGTNWNEISRSMDVR